MRLLDLFCGGGGCGTGYAQAGFEVVGCDIEPQPRNPHTVIVGDWLDILKEYDDDFDIFHASPPCQLYTKSAMQWRKAGRVYPDLIADVRREFEKRGKPYIIENVPGAPLHNPILLNGSFFGLLVHRPRFFECSFPIEQPFIPKTGRPVKMGRPVKEGNIIQPVGHFSGVAYAQRQMGIDWLGQKGLAQAIPPAYTEWIGKAFLNFWSNQNNED